MGDPSTHLDMDARIRYRSAIHPLERKRWGRDMEETHSLDLTVKLIITVL